MTLAEKTYAYSPCTDLAARYPTWWVTAADFGSRPFSHVICWAEKTIVVDPAKFCGDHDWALAHVVVHLDEHMDRLGRLTVEDCEMADYIAHVRLDRECDRP